MKEIQQGFVDELVVRVQEQVKTYWLCKREGNIQGMSDACYGIKKAANELGEYV